MIYLPPVNNIQLQSSSQDDPFASLKKNLDDVMSGMPSKTQKGAR